MYHTLRDTISAVYFTLLALGPAFGQPPCPPAPFEATDVTATIPCWRLHYDLLAFLATADIPFSTGFAAIQHFIENRPARELQLTWIGSNFAHHFRPKVEAPEARHVLNGYRLRMRTDDQTILDKIGGKKTIANLHDIWILLSKQSHGEAGLLTTDGTPNLFYVRDAMGRMWAVDSVWSGAGWEIGASQLNSVMRERGTHIFAR